MMEPFVGTWKVKDSDVWLRAYGNGRVVRWNKTGYAAWGNLLLKHGCFSFYDYDASLVRHGTTLEFQSPDGSALYYRLPQNLEPPTRP